jgi:putative ABC transport system permease protein
VSKRTLSLAWTTIKGRRGGFVAAFVAVLFGSAIVTASGILLETGIRSGVPTERYRAAAVVVGARQTLPVAGDVDPRFSERVPLPVELVQTVARVPGVRAAVGDVDVPVSLRAPDGRTLDGPDGHRLSGHGWPAAALGPFALSAGRQPAAPDDVVLDSPLAERAGISVGDSVELMVGSTTSSYRVTGVVSPPAGELARQSALFFTDEQARQLSGQPNQVDTIGVLADPGTGPAQLAARIKHAVPNIVVYTGRGRGDAEFVDVGQMRSQVIELALSFGATMVMVVLIVVASTLALSVQQRRRELALLRAIGATPKQVLSMIGAEATLVGVAGAALGVVPGIGLGVLFRETFAAVGALPEDFALALSPLPVLAAMVLCVAGARVGGRIAARRAAKASPVEALGQAAVEPRKLGWIRLTMGTLLIPAALAAAIVLPVVLPGEAGVDGASSSALLLVVAVALLGPRLLGGAVSVLGPRLNRSAAASGFLAVANARAKARRLSSATTPLIIGVTMAAAQIFSATTLSSVAAKQAADGNIADYVVTATSAGLSPGLADRLGGAAGVSAVTPVVRTQAMVTYTSGDSTQYKTFAAQGVAPDGITQTMDLGVLKGDIADLRGDAVALSRIAAGTIGVSVADPIHVHLADGAAIRARVVAIYERGLGFGDVTLPHDMVIRHAAHHLDSWMLVKAAPGTDTINVGEALRSATEHSPVVVADRESFVAARNGGGGSVADSAISLIFNAILLGYLAIAVVNTLVMATVARGREFATLQLIGARRDQVRSMMRREAMIVVVAAVLIGTVVSIPPLVGISVAVAGSPIPSVSPLGYAGIVAAATFLAGPAIMISTRVAMRRKPVQAAGSS